MANQPGPFTLAVEYCQSCESHSWCTHHDEAKYRQTYKKLKKLVQNEFPGQIQVDGNRLPQQLHPVKPSENKYFNTKTNKYVTFPIIGAFEIMFEGEQLFSKKKTNTWPNFDQIIDQLYFLIQGKERKRQNTQESESKTKNKTQQSPKQFLPSSNKTNSDFYDKTQKDNQSQANRSFLDRIDKRTTFHKSKGKNKISQKDPSNKGFTLTDHFKNYKKQKAPTNQFSEPPTDNDVTSIGSMRNSQEFMDFKRNFEEYGLGKDGNVPEFIKRKAQFKDDSGRKEMIIRLDSIEEESMLIEDGKQNARRSSYKKKKENIIKKFDEEFNELEEKFKTFEQKVSSIRNCDVRNDQDLPRINQKVMREYKSLQKERKVRKSQQNNTVQEGLKHSRQRGHYHQQDLQSQIDNPIVFARKKINNIDDYINGTEEEKNEKLKKIYGEWQLLKKRPYKKKNYNYVSPYRAEKVVAKSTSRNTKKENSSKDCPLECDSSSLEDSSSASTDNQSDIEEQKPAQKRLPTVAHAKGINLQKKNSSSPKDKFYSTARDQFSRFSGKDPNFTAGNQQSFNFPHKQKVTNKAIFNGFQERENERFQHLSKRTPNSLQKNTKKRNKQNMNSLPTKRGRQMSRDKQAAFQQYKQQQLQKSSFEKYKGQFKHGEAKFQKQNGVKTKHKYRTQQEVISNHESSLSKIPSSHINQSGLQKVHNQPKNIHIPKSQHSQFQSDNIDSQLASHDPSIHKELRKAKQLKGKEQQTRQQSGHESVERSSVGNKEKVMKKKKQKKVNSKSKEVRRNDKPEDGQLTDHNGQGIESRTVENTKSKQRKAQQKVQEQSLSGGQQFESCHQNKVQSDQRQTSERANAKYSNQSVDRHRKSKNQKKVNKKNIKAKTSLSRAILNGSHQDHQNIHDTSERSQVQSQTESGSSYQSQELTHGEKLFEEGSSSPQHRLKSDLSNENKVKRSHSHSSSQQSIKSQGIQKQEDSIQSSDPNNKSEKIRQSRMRKKKIKESTIQQKGSKKLNKTIQQENASKSRKSSGEFLKTQTDSESCRDIQEAQQQQRQSACLKKQQCRKNKKGEAAKSKVGQVFPVNNQQKQLNQNVADLKASESQEQVEESESGTENQNESSKVLSIPSQPSHQKERVQKISNSRKNKSKRQKQGISSHQQSEQFSSTELQKVKSDRQQNDEIESNKKEDSKLSALEKAIEKEEGDSAEVKCLSVSKNQSSHNAKELIEPTNRSSVCSTQRKNRIVNVYQEQNANSSESQGAQTDSQQDSQNSENSSEGSEAEASQQSNCSQSSEQVCDRDLKEQQEKRSQTKMKKRQVGNGKKHMKKNQIQKNQQENADSSPSKQMTKTKQKIEDQQNGSCLEQTDDIQPNNVYFESRQGACRVPQASISRDNLEVRAKQFVDAEVQFNSYREDKCVDANAESQLSQGEQNRHEEMLEKAATIRPDSSEGKKLLEDQNTCERQKSQSKSLSRRSIEEIQPRDQPPEGQNAEKQRQNVENQGQILTKCESQDDNVEMQESNKSQEILKCEQESAKNEHHDSSSKLESGQQSDKKAQKQGQQSGRISTVSQNESKTQPRSELENQNKHLETPKSSRITGPTRAPILNQLFGQNIQAQSKLFVSHSSTNFSKWTASELDKSDSGGSQRSLRKQFPSALLFDEQAIEAQKILQSSVKLPEVLKVIKILTNINEFLIIRLFENPFQKTQSHFGVWLCINYEWKCLIFDDQFCTVDSNSNTPKHLYQKGNKQVWPIVLVKALALAVGGFDKLANMPCYKLFSLLTGSNALFFNVKEDPTKNGRILRYISECENKNFIIHGEKVCRNLEELQAKERLTKIYYILSQKTVNDNEVLIEVQDGSKPSSVCIKLTKFVQEFKSIEILQLRTNHNFTHIDLPKPLEKKLTIVELDFVQAAFGSMTLSTISGETTKELKAYLYREQKSNILKLVGQARQKNKSCLFFDCYFSDCKYYVFAESSVATRLSYLGENQPLLKVVEEINTSDGMNFKSDYTEYLPVKQFAKDSKENMGELPKALNKNVMGDTGMSFKSTQDNKISLLRENFVEYLLKARENGSI